MTSITQLAKELKVTRARVYQIIEKLDNDKKPKKKDDRYILDDQAVKNIRQYFIKTSIKSNDTRQKKNDSKDDSQTIRILESQLDVKDRQIEKLQKLVDQSQQLQLQTQKQLESTSEKLKLLEAKKEPSDKPSENVKKDSNINIKEQSQKPSDDAREPNNGALKRKWWQLWK